VGQLQAWVEAESESAAWFRDVVSRISRKAALLRDPDLARIVQLKAANGWNPCWAGQYGAKKQLRFRQVEDLLTRSRKAQDEENRQIEAARKREKRWLWATIGLLSLLLISLSLFWLSRRESQRRQAEAEQRLLKLNKNLSDRDQQAEAAKRALQEAQDALSRASGMSVEEHKKLEDAVKLASDKASASIAEAQKARDVLTQQESRTNLQQSQADSALKQIGDLQAQLTGTRKQLDSALAAQRAAEEELKKPPAQPESAAVKGGAPITLAPLATLTGHRDLVNTAAFSPDGKRVVTASFDNTARVWDAESVLAKSP